MMTQAELQLLPVVELVHLSNPIEFVRCDEQRPWIVLNGACLDGACDDRAAALVLATLGIYNKSGVDGI